MFNSDIYVKGKHATYIKYLSKKTEKNDRKEKVAGVFERAIDVYMVAPIIGLVYGLRRDEDKASADDVKIFADTVNREQLNLVYIYRMVLLVDNSRGLSADEKIELAFRTPEKEENMKLFNSYLRGGIEWLFEQFTSGATTKDEYLAKINEIVSTFVDENLFN